MFMKWIIIFSIFFWPYKNINCVERNQTLEETNGINIHYTIPKTLMIPRYAMICSQKFGLQDLYVKSTQKFLQLKILD